MSQKIFREKALVKLASPEDLDRLIRVTDIRGWIALTGLAALVIAALVWGIFGTIPTLSKGNGLLIRQDGLQEIKTSAAGQVLELNIKAGDTIKEAQVIGKFKNEAGTSGEIRSPYSGTVLEVLAEKGSNLKAETTLATLERTDQPLEAVIFVPLAEGKNLHPGIKAQLSPSTVRTEEAGYLLGTVKSVSPFPVSSESLLRTLKNEDLAKSLAQSGPVVRVEISLETDQGNPSGFKWSSSGGTRTLLTGGTPCTVNLILGEQRPISLVLPIFKGQEA